MKVHHLNCGTMRPLGGRLVNGGGRRKARLVCHCLLIEAPRSLVLVDTGFGLDDLAEPKRRIGRALLTVGRPTLDSAETAAEQVERLGFSRRDVRHIVLTHMDVDHAGGLGDFPEAFVHVHEDEYRAAMERRTWIERHRYKPDQWAHGPSWVRHAAVGDTWKGLECVRQLEGLPPEVLLVPLAGHTRGHCAVAVQQQGGPWLVHGGDAYFYREEMADNARCTMGLSLFQRITEVDRPARLQNQAKLRALAREHASEVSVFSAHDPDELERLSEASTR